MTLNKTFFLTSESMVILWISRIWCIIAVLVCIFILKREYRNRQNVTTQTNDDKNIYLKFLDFWSLLTIILCVISPLFQLIAIIHPSLCFVSKISGTSTTNLSYALILYQVSRLQYCFYSRQIHSTQWGYPQSIFIALYIYGGCFSLYATSLIWTTAQYVPSNNYGCIMLPTNKLEDMLVTIAFIGFAVWDWTVLLLYCVKIRQIYKKKSSQENKNYQEILNRIYITLRKIIFLTLWGESLVFGTITSQLFPDGNGVVFVLPLHSMGYAIITYLMIESNKTEYDKIIHYLYKSKVCCCCNCLIKDVEIASDQDKNLEKTIEKTMDKYDTTGNSVQIDHEQYDDPSEITVTEI